MLIFWLSLQSSQIDSSVTESEGEVEDPLAESSVSFFSGYEHTPKHQVEQAEDIQQQDSWTASPVNQDSAADFHQDSWSGGMDPEATQPEQPPVQDATSTQQLPAPWSEPPPAVNPPQQQPFFVPGPPVSQFPAPMEREQPASTYEEQPVYSQQPSWNDQEPYWNDSRQSSFSEGVRHEEPKKVEPPPPKGIV